MKAPAFAYCKPATLAETFELLARYGEDAKLLAGGQSLMPALNMRLSSPRVLVDINNLPELRGIGVRDGVMRIGALTRHRELMESFEVAQHAPLIAQAMPYVAHAAIRNRGTIGGSLAFADPAAELPACCVALDAVIVLASGAGERRVRARDFFQGLYTTAMRADEVLAAVEVALGRAPPQSVFIELARRRGDYAVVGLALKADRSDGAYSNAAAVFFGVADRPVLARGLSGLLDGARAAAGLVTAAQEALGQELQPNGDLYHGAATKLHLAKVLLRRALENLDSAEHVRPASGRSTTAHEGAPRRPELARAHDQVDIQTTVNGETVTARVPARRHLVDFLREDLGLQGTHLGCEHGVCGACTVRVDGEIVRGCLMLAAQVHGARVETIEGSGEAATVRRLQQAFHARNAAQCGFCSPAMLLTAAALVEAEPSATRERIRETLSGNYCRCTGYHAIVDAVEAVCAQQERA